MTTIKKIHPAEDTASPQAIELEQAVLGAVMVEQGAFAQIADFMEPEHFYVKSHQLIFEAIRSLVSEGQKVDILTVTERLRFSSKLDIAGGPFYISQLTCKVVTSAHIQVHARIVQQKFILRTFKDLGARLTKIDDTDDCFDVQAEAENAFASVRTITNSADPINAFAIATQIIENRERPQRLWMGLGPVDQCVGVGPGDIVVIGARPAVGKTAVALQIARSFASQKCPVVFITLEMSGEQLVNRILSSLTGIDSNRITSNDLSEYDRDVMAKAQADHASWFGKLHVEDRSTLRSGELFGLFHRYKQRFGAGAVIIDYLQLMEGEGDTNTERMSNISKWCKQAAKANGIRLIELSQLRRLSISAAGKEAPPTMADLRDSGQLEADGDMIILLHREKGSSELGINLAKHKFGPVGDFTVYYDLQHQRIGGIPASGTQFPKPTPEHEQDGPF